jgi:hypothetical protein
VVGDEGCVISQPHVSSSRAEVLSVFAVRHLQVGAIPTAIHPMLSM